MVKNKTSVGIIFGGKSGEHDVSIKSALTIINALGSGTNLNTYKVVPIYIDLQGRWWDSKIANDALKKKSAIQEDQMPIPIPEAGFKTLPINHDDIDIWFPVLHGPNGEDGTVQGLLKLIGKPFIGSGVLGSALGMDKIAMKAAFKAAELPQVNFIAIEDMDLYKDSLLQNLLNEIEKKLKYPCFIKPANLGSSVGISKAENQKEVIQGIKKALSLDKRIIIEESVQGRELECAALGNQDMKISEVGEVNLKGSEWYDYKTKYSNQSNSPIIPAQIPEEVKKEIQNLTYQACKAISAKGIARVDFFYIEKNNKLFINEINTLPGFTEQSMYPSLWEASGLTIQQLVAQLVDSARQ